MSKRRIFGDLCQNHPVMTAPIVYPYEMTEEPDGGGLRALYRCWVCGAEWPCWWGADISEWEAAGDAA